MVANVHTLSRSDTSVPLPFGERDAPFSVSEMRAANVNAISGLATDFLNPYNEYLMLGEMAAMDPDAATMAAEWQAISYQDHFMQAEFAGCDTVLEVYQALDPTYRLAFEAEVYALVRLIRSHQQAPNAQLLSEIATQRDRVAHFITPVSDQMHVDEQSDTQASIDALFD